jgi:hypothetical protein
LGHTRSALTNQLESALQAEVHDVTVWSDPNRARKDSREVERTAAGDVREDRHLDGLVEVGHDVVPDPRQHIPAQASPHPALGWRGVKVDQPVDEAGRNVIPVPRPIWIIVGALQRQTPRKLEKRLVMALQTLDDPGLERLILCSCQREAARIDGDKERIEVSICIHDKVNSCRSYRKHPERTYVLERPAGKPAFEAHVFRQLKEDNVLLDLALEMRTALEARSQNGDTALARRAADSQRRRLTAVLLGQGKVRAFQHGSVCLLPRGAFMGSEHEPHREFGLT